MYRRQLMGVVSLALACILLNGAGFAAEDDASSESPATDGANEPVQLFNGVDLSGWTYKLSEPDVTMDDVWSVRDGVLICRGRPAGYLLTEADDFKNYVLTLQWRWPGKGGNSGALVHVSTPQELGVWPKCLEVQLGTGDAGDFWVLGSTIDVENESERRSGRRHLNLTDGSEKPLGQWNTMEITCRDGDVTVKVNGTLVNHGTNCSERRGAIGLQSEGTEIHFRRVELRPLDDAQ